MALLEILDSGKPKYAPLIAENLCKLTREELPPKVIEFFAKVKAGAEL